MREKNIFASLVLPQRFVRAPGVSVGQIIGLGSYNLYLLVVCSQLNSTPEMIDFVNGIR